MKRQQGPQSANKRANLRKKSLFGYAYDSIEVYLYIYESWAYTFIRFFPSFCENIKKRAENILNNNNNSNNNNNVIINSTNKNHSNKRDKPHSGNVLQTICNISDSRSQKRREKTKSRVQNRDRVKVFVFYTTIRCSAN